MFKQTALLLTVSGFVMGGPAQAADLASVSKLAFGADGTLFVADWRAAQIDAIALPAAQRLRSTFLTSIRP